MRGAAGKNFVLEEPMWSLKELRLSRPDAEAGTHEGVTPATLNKLAKLALIDLSQQPDITDQLEEDVNVILRCASSLRSFTASDGGAAIADVARVVTVAEQLTPSQLRKDADAQTKDMSEELLRNSRDSHDGFFVAPKD
jgi:Asp-tRNA(Asn)/Glu-tRNA(Gln) amidotransferase C subunit